MTSTVRAQGLAMSAVPVWLILLAFLIAAAVIAYAIVGVPGRAVAHRRDDEDSALATLFEIQNADRGLSTHANGVLTLSIIAAGAFATVVQTKGGPSMPMVFATVVALFTGGIIATTAFALEGGATAAATLPIDELHACVERNLHRSARRLRCVRVATWCLVPIVLLVVISIAEVRH